MSKEIYLNHHMLNLSGGPISVYEAGDQNLPPVLLLHGAMYDEARLTWLHLAPFLSKYRRVFALDFPRHGQSRPWTGFVGQRCLMNIVEEVIRHFDLSPLPLIGLSMGGAVSIGYALKKPGEITGLVLLGPGGLGDRIKNQFLSWAFVKTPGVLTALTRYYGKMSPEKMRKSLAPLFDSKENAPDFDNLIAIIIEEARLKWKYRENSMDDWQLEGLAPFRLKINFLPQLHLLACPSLWIRGENDPLVSRKDMEQAARLAPEGSFLQIKSAGHLLPLEQPDEVKKAVLDFLLKHNL